MKRWLLVVWLSAASCIPAFAQAPLKVLRVAPSADLTQLDPGFASIVITRIYGLMVYETLFAWDSQLQPKPQMVSDWSTAPDQLSWRFTLRPGLKFHDGQPVTTADVIPSLKRWMERDVVGQKLAGAVTGMDAIDAEHVRDQAVQAVSGDAVLARLRHRPGADHHARPRPAG